MKKRKPTVISLYIVVFLVMTNMVQAILVGDTVTNAFNDLKRQGTVNEKESFMRLKSSLSEVNHLIASNPLESYFIFPEERYNDIRSMNFLPQHWMDYSVEKRGLYKAKIQPGEFFTFQIGVFAAKDSLVDVAILFKPLRGKGDKISASAFRCFNLGGVDKFGKEFEKKLNIPKGKVQPLWIGIEIPQDAKGQYKGQVIIQSRNGEKKELNLVFDIEGDVLLDAGDGQAWRHSRLRWLDSNIGGTNEPIDIYQSIVVDGTTLKYLGGEMTLNNLGLPQKLATYYNESNTLDPISYNPILAETFDFIIETTQGEERLKNKSMKIRQDGRGRATWTAIASNANLQLKTTGTFEFDGFTKISIEIKAKKEIFVRDIRLEIPYAESASSLFMGLGRVGGKRSFDQFVWSWDKAKRQDEFWMGSVNSGLKVRLMDADYQRPLVNVYYQLGQIKLPNSWWNNNNGGINISENQKEKEVRVIAYSGERTMKKGELLNYNMELMITPVKPIDLAKSSSLRFYHSNSDLSDNYIKEAKLAGANSLNIHHKKDIYPYINYPYADENINDLSEFSAKANNEDLNLRLYYTTRELTVKIPEIWALKSLNGEVIYDGPGKDTRTLIHANGPNLWLNENFESHFIPAWYTGFNEGKYKGDMDLSVITTPDSRWNNYYLQGLDWMVKNINLNGIYIDDSALDRETLKRAKYILMQKENNGTIDLHSWNHMNKYAGEASSLMIYMDLFPYVDKLWIGEGFTQERALDFWLVEMSGIPFGLMSETLDARNYWKGMVFGMIPRLPWSGDPKPLWTLFDRFGLDQSLFLGYWDQRNPIKSSNKEVPVTVYKQKNKALVVIGNFTGDAVNVDLMVDIDKLGFTFSKISMPHVDNIQEETNIDIRTSLEIEKDKGLFILFEE